MFLTGRGVLKPGTGKREALRLVCAWKVCVAPGSCLTMRIVNPWCAALVAKSSSPAISEARRFSIDARKFRRVS
jgi:hypothetical protein